MNYLIKQGNERCLNVAGSSHVFRHSGRWTLCFWCQLNATSLTEASIKQPWDIIQSLVNPKYKETPNWWVWHQLLMVRGKCSMVSEDINCSQGRATQLGGWVIPFCFLAGIFMILFMSLMQSTSFQREPSNEMEVGWIWAVSFVQNKDWSFLFHRIISRIDLKEHHSF